MKFFTVFYCLPIALLEIALGSWLSGKVHFTKLVAYISSSSRPIGFIPFERSYGQFNTALEQLYIHFFFNAYIASFWVAHFFFLKL